MKIASLIILSLLPVAFSQNAGSDSGSISDENVRVKRAGFSLFTGALQNLQKGAFGASAQLSSGSSSSSSSGSSGSSSSSGHESDGHSYSGDFEPHQDTKSFDGWSLKKSILNTLLQAVKAIAGGVTSLSGQAIKGSGYLVSQKGKLIAASGDAVSAAGVNIAKSAHLIEPESSGHGYGGSSNSIGHSLGSSFGGLSKALSGSISSLSSGSAGAVSGLSAGSSGKIASLSSSSSGSSSGHSSGNSDTHSHGEAYASVDGPSHSYNIPESNHYESYDVKPAVQYAYGSPKVIESYAMPASYNHDPHSSYGSPQYNDGSYSSSTNQEASDVLSDILKNLPIKPMKSVGHGQQSSGGYSSSGGHSFNQYPLPNDFSPPAFKPLSGPPTFDLPFENIQTFDSAHGPPTHYSDYSGQSSNKDLTAVNPKAYEIYHSMHNKLKQANNFVTLPTLTDTNIGNSNRLGGYVVQKSIEYDLTGR